MRKLDISKLFLLFIIIFSVPKAGFPDEKAKIKEMHFSSFSFVSDNRFEEKAKNANHLTLDYEDVDRVAKGDIPPNMIQVIFADSSKLEELTPLSNSKLKKEMVIFMTSFNDRMEKNLDTKGAFVSKTQPKTLETPHLWGYKQRIEMNMFTGTGFEQYLDSYLLTEGNKFIFLQVIYFPKHEAEVKEMMEPIFSSLKLSNASNI